MGFNSFEYAVFLPVVVLVYFMAPGRARGMVLLAASYVFYAAWNVRYLGLVIAMTALNYGVGLLLPPVGDRRRPRSWLAFAVGANVAVLCFYKYALFLLGSVEGLATFVGLSLSLPHPTILLPLAISFFTFEFVHYVVDVWKGSPPVRSPIKFAVFAAFFPTQIAGPIKRYQLFVPQLDLVARFDWTRTGAGLRLILYGLFKKLVLADRLAPVVGRGFQDGAAQTVPLGPLDAWLSVLAFAMQVYFDFSGYTDIGRGSAAILGFTVPENFRRPYLARSVAEFWRRWHISLSTWLRDYLFVPLGGLRGRPYRSLLVTMGLGGLWHGASWAFVAWGVWHGALLCLEWATRSSGLAARAERNGGGAAASVLRWLATFMLVCLGYAFFRSPSIRGALRLIGDMLGVHLRAPAVLPPDERLLVAAIAAGCLLLELAIERMERRPVTAPMAKRPIVLAGVAVVLRPVGYALLLAATIVFAYDARAPFIYFRF